MFCFKFNALTRLACLSLILGMGTGTGMVAVFSAVPAVAGVVLDGTMGQSGELDGPFYEITADLGTRAGTNLFHSFETFSIDTDEAAVFRGPAAISRIISRITGGTYSRIDGKVISAIPGADLYLLNSAGILFGNNASLDIDGSLHVSTADYLTLADDERFYTLPFDNELLSFAKPEAFGFLDDDIAAIGFRGEDTRLSLSPGKTLSVVGGDIILNQTTLSAAQGKIDLVSLASAGEVTPSGHGVEVTSGAGGTVSMTGHSRVDVGGDTAGSVHIFSDQLLMNNSLVSAKSASENTDNGCSIDVDANHILLINRSGLTTAVSGEGDAGDIRIRDNDRLVLRSGSFISGSTRGRGDGGAIRIDTERVLLENASISSESRRSADGGDAGSIEIDVKEKMALRNSRISTEAVDGGRGRTAIKGDGLLYLSSSTISASVRSGANSGGGVAIEQDAVVLNRSDITANAHEGEGGSITIASRSLVKSQDSRIDAASNRGNDGDVEIRSSDNAYYQNLIAMEAELMDADQWVQTPCSTRSGKDVSHLYVQGREGRPNDPEDWQPSPLLLLTR